MAEKHGEPVTIEEFERFIRSRYISVKIELCRKSRERLLSQEVRITATRRTGTKLKIAIEAKTLSEALMMVVDEINEKLWPGQFT